jgi:enoyl-CoA hydratase
LTTIDTPEGAPVEYPPFETLTLEDDGGVTWLTLNRPAKLNALSDQLLEELGLALDAIERSETTRVVVLRGAGRAFSAGYDLSPDAAEIGEAETRSPIDERDRLVGNIELFTRIWRFPVPVIAAIHGYCVGGGAQLASFCDITVVADDAIIMASPTLLIGGGYLSPIWAHLVGPKRAKLVSFDAGHRISGKVAAEWGWAAQSVPPELFDEHVRNLARSIARTPAGVLRLKKEAINRSTELQGFLTYARTGAETDALLHFSPEIREIQRWIREDGLRAAIDRFAESGLPDPTDLR